MRAPRFFTAAGWMAGTGLGTAGLAVALTGTPMVVASTATVALALGSLAAAGAGGVHWIRTRLPIARLAPRDAYSSRWAASDADIADAYDLFVGQLEDGGEVSVELMRLLHARNPQTVRLVERHRGSESRLMGMVLLAPLTPGGEDRIRRREMRDSFDASIEQDAASTWQTDAAYIGGIAGSSVPGRAHALAFCEAWLNERGVTRAYARPISGDGERIMRRWGFHPLGAPSRFWTWESARPSSAASGSETRPRRLTDD